MQLEGLGKLKKSSKVTYFCGEKQLGKVSEATCSTIPSLSTREWGASEIINLSDSLYSVLRAGIVSPYSDWLQAGRLRDRISSPESRVPSPESR
jgi:hypothetical protein